MKTIHAKTSVPGAALRGTKEDVRIYRIALTGLFAALSYIVFTFLQIKITLPGGDATSIHLGNAVCVLGALLIGGFYGGLGGAIGMTIGDLLDPVYVIYAPKTLILKLCIGLIAGPVGHGIFKIGRICGEDNKRKLLLAAAAASVCALGFNVIFDPLLGYYYKLLILGKPAAEVALAWNIASTSINAVVSAAVSTALYLPLRTALRRCGMGAVIR